jgi:hypothetical protein
LSENFEKISRFVERFLERIGGTLIDLVTLLIAAFADPKSPAGFRWLGGILGSIFHAAYLHHAYILWAGKKKHDRKFSLLFFLAALAGLFFTLTLIVQLTFPITPLLSMGVLLPAIYITLTLILFFQFVKKAIESHAERQFLNKETKKLFMEFAIGLLILTAFVLEGTTWLGANLSLWASTVPIYSFMTIPLPLSGILFLLSMLLSRLNEENLGGKIDKHSNKYKYFLVILILSVTIDLVASLGFKNPLILTTLGGVVVTGPLLGFVTAILLYVGHKIASSAYFENRTPETQNLVSKKDVSDSSSSRSSSTHSISSTLNADEKSTDPLPVSTVDKEATDTGAIEPNSRPHGSFGYAQENDKTSTTDRSPDGLRQGTNPS